MWNGLNLPYLNGMLAGIGFTTAYIVYFKFINPVASVPENWFLGVSPEGIGTIGMLINFVVAAIDYKNTSEAPEHIQQLVESQRLR